MYAERGQHSKNTDDGTEAQRPVKTHHAELVKQVAAGNSEKKPKHQRNSPLNRG